MLSISAHSIIALGDTHYETEHLNRVIDETANPDVILQCGDFGFIWDRFWKSDCEGINLGTTKIFWCPGNHENWNILDTLSPRVATTPVEIYSNIYYCPIGSILSINGKNILFVGGAKSIDKYYYFSDLKRAQKNYGYIVDVYGRENKLKDVPDSILAKVEIPRRMPNVAWWAQEQLTHDDLDWIYTNVSEQDIHMVISHTCPKEFKVGDGHKDESQDMLSAILATYAPKYWMFGHMHQYDSGRFNDTAWTVLDKINTCTGGRAYVDVSGVFNSSIHSDNVDSPSSI